MKYWLLTTEFPPLHGGGISTYCHFTAKMLSGNGYAVTILVPDDTIRDHIVTREPTGITLIRFNSNRNNLQAALGYSARLSYAFADMVRFLVGKEGKPDILEAQDYLGIAYYLTQFKHLGYAFLAGVPIVLTLHSPAFIYLEYNRVPTYRFPDFWTCEMEKHSIRAADVLISPTRFLTEEIQKHMDISDKCVEILANPYLPADLLTAGPGFSPGKIVYYGKLSPQKGSFELLAYFKELWDDGFPHALHIVGGTDIVYHPEMQTMGQLVNKRYSAYIEKGLLNLHGKIRPSQIREYLSDAQVIIVPSIVDNLPYVVMEAMSLGKVVLASVQGGQKEMIGSGYSGFLFDHREPSSFSRELKKILSLTGEEVNRIGVNAAQAVRDTYSFETVYRKKNSLLQRVLAESKEEIKERNLFPFLYQEKIPVGTDSEGTSDTLLSVVIPYYNMGAYLDDSIGSIRRSSYKEIEIVIINDGSTDPGSLAKLDAIGRLPGITIHNQPNRGLAFARNKGAKMAKGAYLAFLDADDKVAPAYYEKAIHALQASDNVFFAGSWVQYFGNSDRIWPAFTPQPPYALVHNPVNSSGLVYKKNAFLMGGMNDKAVDYGLEDYESVISMLAHGFNGVVLPEILFYYRVRSGSMFRDISEKKLLYSNKYITEKHVAYYSQFAPEIINLLNANGPGYLFDNPTFEVIVSSTIQKDHFVIVKLKSLIRKNEKLKKIALSVLKYFKA